MYHGICALMPQMHFCLQWPNGLSAPNPLACSSFTLQVPEDFDAATMLPGADTTSKKHIIATFPLVFLQRWMTLRAEVCFMSWLTYLCLETGAENWIFRAHSQTLLHEQVPEEEQEKYEKGQHLRGKDAELAVQVCAEMVCISLPRSIHSFADLACAPLSRNNRC